jgi:uncharacterized protein YndB with AHSA1/START domain
MLKQQITLEYHLSRAAINPVWNLISDSHGLSDWFADEVTENNGVFTFRWGKDHLQEAVLKKRKEQSYIRFQWKDDEKSDYYFEIRLQFQELTRDLTLIITDFAEPSEIDDLKLLWQQQIETLCRKLGM